MDISEDSYADDLFENFEELIKKYEINPKIQHSVTSDKDKREFGNEFQINGEDNQPVPVPVTTNIVDLASRNTEQCIKSCIESAREFDKFVWHILPNLKIDDDWNTFDELNNEPESSGEKEINVVTNINHSLFNNGNYVTDEERPSTSNNVQKKKSVSVTKSCQEKKVLRNSKRDTAVKNGKKYTEEEKTKEEDNILSKTKKIGKLNARTLSSKRPKYFHSNTSKVGRKNNKMVSKAPKNKCTPKSMQIKDKVNSMSSPRLKKMKPLKTPPVKENQERKTSIRKRRGYSNQYFLTQIVAPCFIEKTLSKNLDEKVKNNQDRERFKNQISNKKLKNEGERKSSNLRKEVRKSNKVYSQSSKKSCSLKPQQHKNAKKSCNKQMTEHKVDKVFRNLRMPKNLEYLTLRKRKVNVNDNEMIYKKSEKKCTSKLAMKNKKMTIPIPTTKLLNRKASEPYSCPIKYIQNKKKLNQIFTPQHLQPQKPFKIKCDLGKVSKTENRPCTTKKQKSKKYIELRRNVGRKKLEVAENEIKSSSRTLRSSNVEKHLSSKKTCPFQPVAQQNISKASNKKEVKDKNVDIISLNMKSLEKTNPYELRKRKIGNESNDIITIAPKRMCTLRSKQ